MTTVITHTAKGKPPVTLEGTAQKAATWPRMVPFVWDHGDAGFVYADETTSPRPKELSVRLSAGRSTITGQELGRPEIEMVTFFLRGLRQEVNLFIEMNRSADHLGGGLDRPPREP